ncbi:hypothetical protein [Pseudalkalibacillus hwajinpoensis]|nr:hypothetical protein [Pseudalkalibacillus hwajinpoensis]
MMESCVVTTKHGVIEYVLSNHTITPIVLLSGIGDHFMSGRKSYPVD